MTKEAIVQALESLKKVYGTRPWNWHTRQKPFYVLIATILSQRTRDPQTDESAKRLFDKFPTPQDLASAPVETIEDLIKPVNFFKTKAKRIKEVSRLICENFGGNVPDSLEELMRLPGVGRKTANCVLLYGFHRPALPVDTHVHRIANRLGWVKTVSPEETEVALSQIIPLEWIHLVNDLMVKHGQTICYPKKPKCFVCPILSVCKYGVKVGSQEASSRL